MTEAEWVTCTNPTRIIDAVPGQVSERKLRLFAVACCYAEPATLWDERCRRAAEVGERHADGLAGSDELLAAWRDVTEALEWAISEQEFERAALTTFARNCALPSHMWVEWWGECYRGRYRSRHCPILRDVIPNPFRSLVVDADWLSTTVVGLTSAIYAERAFDRLPILADALEDAGCDDEQLLAHCRSGGPHVRGCWAVDLVLGKS